MIDLIALSAAKKHAELLAMGLISVSVDNTNKSITFTLAADGSQRTIYFDQPSDGISIVGIEIKNGHLICLMSDGSEIDAGVLPSGGSGGGSVPKPLTYDYMPEGYPSKSIQTVTLMEEQEVAFASWGGGYEAQLTEALAITEGQTYTVNWDGTEYECVCSVFNSTPILGNLSIMDVGDDTGEPFIYISVERMFGTLDTSASHTISVKTVAEAITPMAYDYMPEGYPKKRGCNIEWDGNTEGLVSVLEMLYKVSDLLPTDDELIGSTIELSNRKKVEITSDMLNTTSEDITFIGKGDLLIAVVKKDNAIFEDTTFPQKGTYFAKQQNIKASKPNSFYVKKLAGVITPMAEEFIPLKIKKDIGAVRSVATNAQTTANNAVSYAFYQQLTDEQKEQARTNIGIGTDKPFKPAGESYLTFSSPNRFTLAVKNATKRWDGTLEYFTSDGTWTTWNANSILSAIPYYSEYVLYLRGTGNTIITGNISGSYWVLTGTDIKCIGNIENLLDYATVESGAHPTLKLGCYSYLFNGCTSLTQAPALPATTLADNCYSNMFKGCTSLIQAPALPATTLASYCYSNMFQECTSLTKAPVLPATTLASYCYSNMFQECTSLTKAPALPATTLADYCYYYMFADCTSLTHAPALPATTLAVRCYSSMFRGCTSLTHAPALPATTLVPDCYSGIFNGCTSLTQAPALPATTLADYCYYYMFADCTSLTQAPVLPATTLADYCYRNMFYGCTSLTQAPVLPATTLANNCYNNMFQGCAGLKLSITLTNEYTQEYRIPSSGDGTTAPAALSNMFASTGGTFTGTPEINTTYYLSSDNMIVRETDIATLNGYVGSMINTAVPTDDHINELINTALSAIGIAEEGAY